MDKLDPLISETEYHFTDLKEAIYYLPESFDRQTLFKALKSVYGEGEGKEIALEYLHKSHQMINNFDNIWKDSKFTKYEESNVDQFITTEVYNIAKKSGWIPKALRKGTKTKKRPSKKALATVERDLTSSKQLKSELAQVKERALPEPEKSFISPGIVNLFGGCYYHPYLKKHEIPEDEQEYKEKLTKVVDCEVMVVEAVEYIIKTKGELEDDKEVRYRLRLDNREGKSVLTEVTHEELTTKTRFSNFLVSKGFVKFLGSNDQFDKFHEFLINGQQYPTVRKETSWGEFQPGTFLFKNGIYDTSEKKFYAADEHHRIAYKNQIIVCPSGSELIQPPELSVPVNYGHTKSILTQAFINWERVNGRINVRCTIAYAMASLYSRRIIKKMGGFPILFKYGERGTGKSSVMDWFMALFGHKTGNRQQITKQNTIKGLTRNMTLPRSFPFFLDDFRDHQTNAGAPDITSPMLNWYHQTGASRAKTSNDNQTIDTQMKATVVMTGNDKPTDSAVLSRMIILTYNTFAKGDNLSLINDITRNLNQFSEFTALILFTYDSLYQVFEGYVKENQNFLANQGFEGRTVNNWSIILGGMRTIPIILPGLEHWEHDFDDLRNEICDSIRKEVDLQKEINPLFEFFEAIEFNATQRKDKEAGFKEDLMVLDHRHFRYKAGNTIRTSNGEIHRDFVLYLNTSGIWKTLESVNDQITRKTSLRIIESKLQESSFYLGHGIQIPLTKSFKDKKESNRRCYALDVGKLKELQKLEELMEKAREYEQERAIRFL